MKLYEISQEYLDIMDAFEDAETEEEVMLLTERLSEMQENFEQKCENYCKIIKTFEGKATVLKSEADVFKAEYDRLKKRSDAMVNRAERLKHNLKCAMEDLGVRDKEVGIFRIKIQKNPPSVRYEDAYKVPTEYVVETEPKIDKAKLKADLQAGVEIPGCRLDQGESLRIR